MSERNQIKNISLLGKKGKARLRSTLSLGSAGGAPTDRFARREAAFALSEHTSRFRNQDIPQAGRVRAAFGKATGLDGAWQHGKPTNLVAQRQLSLEPYKSSSTPVLNISLNGRTGHGGHSWPSNLSSPKPGHTTGGSGRGARRGGGAGSGRTVRPEDKRPAYPPRHRRHVA